METTFSVNHSIKVGEVIRTEGEQCAYASAHEVWQEDTDSSPPNRTGKRVVAGKATIRIVGLPDTRAINTNWMNGRGVVCFLPNCFEDCLILAVRVTRTFTKSVEARPIDWIECEYPPFDHILTHGTQAKEILAHHPDAKRVTIA